MGCYVGKCKKEGVKRGEEREENQVLVIWEFADGASPVRE